MDILYYTKFEFSLKYQAIFNCAIPYFIVLMMTGPEFSEDPENNKINLWPECKLMLLDKIMVDVWDK